MSGKRDSLTANIELLRPSVFCAQETKFVKKGLYNVKDYEIFEAIRKTGGGSVLTGVHCNLNPVLISDGAHDETEVLVVEAEVESKKCRFINGYGPQEGAENEKRINFYARIEEEVLNAKFQGSFVCIQLDANAKLGSEVIEKDSQTQSQREFTFRCNKKK